MDLNEFISVLKFPFNRLHAYTIYIFSFRLDMNQMTASKKKCVMSLLPT